MPFPFSLRCEGRAALIFSLPSGGTISIILTSLYSEVHAPVVSQGALMLSRIDTPVVKKAMEYLLRPPHVVDKSFSFKFHQISDREVKCIEFYGNRERGNAKEFDEYLDRNYCRMLGFEDVPYVDINSVEFIVISFEEDKKITISLEEGGFWFNFNNNQDEYSYILENGYVKNIVLHHLIGANR